MPGPSPGTTVPARHAQRDSVAGVQRPGEVDTQSGAAVVWAFGAEGVAFDAEAI